MCRQLGEGEFAGCVWDGGGQGRVCIYSNHGGERIVGVADELEDFGEGAVWVGASLVVVVVVVVKCYAVGMH